MVPPSRRRRARSPRIEISFKGRLGRYAYRCEGPCRRVARCVGRRLELDGGCEISILLCDGPTMRRLNRRWRSIDRSTNVLSFPLEKLRAGARVPAGPLGDIVVALPVARREARALGLGFERHLGRLVIHGMLHLIGHDHHRGSEAQRMAALERRLAAECEK